MSALKHRRQTIASLIIVAVAVVIAGWLVLNRQWVVDEYRIAQYTPSTEVRAIEDDLKLTDEGKRYFEAAQPQLEEAADFNQHCNQQVETTNNPILGCYVNLSMYIYDVTNPKLDGIEQTTAAHELLHAAWLHLSDGDKAKLEPQLEAAYQSIKTPELEKRMEYYKKHEPGERLNELHSILGSEFSHLGTDLQRYYARYFTDQAHVVSFHKRYSSVFDELSVQRKSLAADINRSIADINRRIGAYNQAAKALQGDIAAFNRRAESGGFTSQAAFDSARADLNARQSALNDEKASIEAAIDTVEGKRHQYNKLVDQSNELNRSINSSLAPTPTL